MAFCLTYLYKNTIIDTLRGLSVRKTFKVECPVSKDLRNYLLTNLLNMFIIYVSK